MAKYMEFQKIPVMCPKCDTKVMTWNGITKIPMTTRCTACNNIVIFDPSTQTTKISVEPSRASTSGKRYY